MPRSLQNAAECAGLTPLIGPCATSRCIALGSPA
eukprot:CAMPEP_0174938978 /NCGR_PEP_ID=MMETSP1355-20121228/65194_1 /TAXON_ID=464990 /ORGANISM="Hemiselmis tepida, Strain CCMP443" /LENGTH=33 /DNA_ID= /DNA_START= /DNA_END= /DNA_ORIENTATION=